jgi:hypothetical protein
VRYVIDTICGEGQIIDISQGGCKILPFHLEPLIENQIDKGAEILLSLGALSASAMLIWATPNRSALGCSFAEPLPELTLASLMGPELFMAPGPAQRALLLT